MRIKPLQILLAAVWVVVNARAADEKSAAPPAANPGTAKAKMVSVEEFDRLRANKANVVLDVRSPAEFKSGHIPGAVNLDVRSPDFEKKVNELDKSKTYLVHCAAGGRSARACRLVFTFTLWDSRAATNFKAHSKKQAGNALALSLCGKMLCCFISERGYWTWRQTVGSQRWPSTEDSWRPAAC